MARSERCYFQEACERYGVLISMSKLFSEGNDRMNKLFGFTINDLTWHNFKYNTKVRLFLGVIVVLATTCALLFDANMDFSTTTRSNETIGKLIACGLMYSLGLCLIIRKRKEPKKNTNDRIVDDLD